MAMQTDVLSAHVNATGQLVTGRVRLKAYQFAPTAVAGTVNFYNGTSATGTPAISIDTTTNLAPIYSLIPGEGMLFPNGIYVSLSNVAGVTIFYA